MSYYQGDYYQGDFYEGDPGFLGNIKRVAGLGLRAATGGLVTKIPTLRATKVPPAPIRAFLPGPLGLDNLTGFGMQPFAGAQVAGCAFKGQRLNKAAYVTRGGGTSRWPQQLLFHPKGSECVKSRRMNVANSRALRRSVRRAQGFAKLARRVLTFVSAKAPKGRPKYKRKRG